MTIEQPNAAAAGLIERVKNILLKPKETWDVIAVEPTTINKLYVGYILPLAAISAIATTIGMVLFGIGGFGFYLRPGLVPSIVAGVLQFAWAFGGVYLMGIIINALAPTFGSQQDQLQAHKLSVYTATAGLLAGVFAIHPALGILGILGIYSLFLLYLGLPKLMKTPADKVIGYFLTIIVVMIVVGIVLGLVVTTIRGAVGGFGGASSWHFGSAQQAPVDQRVELPGGGSIDVGQLERAAQEAQQAYTENGNVKPVDLAQLQALLPDSLPGGFARTSISSSSAGAAMAGASQAEAVYQRGQSSITLSVMQMGGMGALASMAGAMGVQGNHEDANGYSRIRTENGRTVTEELNRASATAEYAVIGRNGVAVSASGQSVTLDDVRAAVNALGVERAEALAAN